MVILPNPFSRRSVPPGSSTGGYSSDLPDNSEIPCCFNRFSRQAARPAVLPRVPFSRGFFPIRKGYRSQSFTGHFRASAVESPEQLRQWARIAFRGVMAFIAQKIPVLHRLHIEPKCSGTFHRNQARLSTSIGNPRTSPRRAGTIPVHPPMNGRNERARHLPLFFRRLLMRAGVDRIVASGGEGMRSERPRYIRF